MPWPTITLFPQPYDARAATRATQGCFVVVLGLAVLTIGVIEPRALTNPGAISAAVLIVIATLIVLLRGSALTPAMPLFYVVPTVNALAIAALRFPAPEATVGALLALVVPAVWLGTSGHLRAVALTGALSALAVTPDIVGFTSGGMSADAGTVSLVTLVPVAMVATALFSYGLVDEAAAATAAEGETRRLRDAIIETIDVGIIVLDAEGEIVLVNQGVREHPITKSFDDVVADTLRGLQAYRADGTTPYPDGDGPIRAAMMSDDSGEQVFWVRQRDGTPHAFAARSTRLRDDHDNVIATVVAVNDVTQFLDALHARDRLMSTVSHELRTPLTAMKGFLELAQEEVADDSSALARHLAIVERNLHRELAIVDHFIRTADSLHSRMRLRLETVDLTSVVQGVVDASTLVSTHPSVEVTVVGEPAQCRIDPALMATAVDAVLSNAIAASGESGAVTLTLTTPISGWIQIDVTDHGVGIEAGDHDRLFEPFFRTRRADTEAVPGVGLGLPLAKQVVDAHGGSIDVESDPTRGTTVSITVPREATDREEESGDGGI